MDEKDNNIIDLVDYKIRKGLKAPRQQVCINCGKRFDHWWSVDLYFCINQGEKHLPGSFPPNGDIFA